VSVLVRFYDIHLSLVKLMTQIRRPYETNAENKTVNKSSTMFDPEASVASRNNIGLWFTVYMRVEYGVCC